jgi:hypothetical protein
MFRKEILFSVMCLVVFGIGNSANADIRHEDPPGPLAREASRFEAWPTAGVPGTLFLPAGPSGMAFKDPEDPEIEKQLKELLKDLKKLEKEVKEKVRKELLPHLKREIEKLRKWLREFDLEGEGKQEPLRTRVPTVPEPGRFLQG